MTPVALDGFLRLHGMDASDDIRRAILSVSSSQFVLDKMYFLIAVDALVRAWQLHLQALQDQIPQ